MEQYPWTPQNKSEPTTVLATPRKTHSNGWANHHKNLFILVKFFAQFLSSSKAFVVSEDKFQQYL